MPARRPQSSTEKRKLVAQSLEIEGFNLEHALTRLLKDAREKPQLGSQESQEHEGKEGSAGPRDRK